MKKAYLGVAFSLLTIAGYADQEELTPLNEELVSREEIIANNEMAENLLPQRQVEVEKKCTPPIFTAQAQFSYFYPISEDFRDIFGDGGINYGFDLAARFYKGFEAFFGFDYFEKEGHSLGGNQKTCVRIIPLSAGLRYGFYPMCWWKIYVGAGPTYHFLKITNDSIYVESKVTKGRVGGVYQFGMDFFPCKYLVIGLFTEYFQQVMPFETKNNQCNITRYDADLSGVNAGGGIGFAF